MKRLLMILGLLTAASGVGAQQSSTIKADLYGFVRNYFCYDTRESSRSSADMFNVLPLDEKLNAYGDDLNENSSARLCVFTTRMGMTLSGGKAAGFDLAGRIEADFNAYTGSTSNIAALRFRQAYVTARHRGTELLLGQAWHPMSGDLLPDVLALASGSPFNPFSRTPQLRVNQTVGSFVFTGAALYQYQFASAGPNGLSEKYLTNSALPEVYLQAALKTKHLHTGVGVDMVSLKPRITGTDADGVEVKVDDRITNFSPFFFFQYTRDFVTVKGKALYGNDTSHLLMMSGYGVTKVNDDGSYDYAPLRNITGWASASVGKKYKFSLFGGYTKNLGAGKDFVTDDAGNISMLYVRGATTKSLHSAWRIVPGFSYNLPAFNVGLEYELTAALYGTPKADGSVHRVHQVANNRLCLMVKYNF